MGLISIHTKSFIEFECDYFECERTIELSRDGGEPNRGEAIFESHERLTARGWSTNGEDRPGKFECWCPLHGLDMGSAHGTQS